MRTEALGREDDTATLHVADAAHAGENTFGEPVYSLTTVVDNVEVPVTTFDHLVDSERLDRIDVVKIDVEGSEELCARRR